MLRNFSNHPGVQRAKTFLQRHPWFVVALPIWVYVGFMVAQLVVQLLAVGLVSLGVHLDSINSAVLSTVVAACIYVVTLVIVIGLPILLKNQKFSGKELGLWRLPEWMDILLAPAGFIIYIVLSGLLAYGFSQLFPQVTASAQNTGFNNLNSSYQYILAFVTLVIIAPFAEELLFRGYLLGKLIKYAPIWLSVLITSLLFGFLHMTISGGGITGWSLGLDTFALSLVLCTLRLITRSIWPSILLHMIKNSVAFAILFIIPLLSGTLVR
jgi:membrane protease YdiL (CAAX protease family)